MLMQGVLTSGGV